MRPIHAIATVWLAAAVTLNTGCSTIRASYDYDPQFDFARLETYNWLPFAKRARQYELTIKRIRRAVDAQLAEKGLRIDAEAPDFLIALHGDTQTRWDVTDWGPSYGYRWGYPYGGPRRVDVYTYQEGTLVLEFIEARANELFWQGRATGIVIDSNPTPARLEKTIKESVTKMLRYFPPPPLK